MKILFITDIVPYPPDTGIKIRTFNILKQLSKRGHRIYLLAFNHRIFINNEETKQQIVSILKSYCEEVRVFEIPSERSRLGHYCLLLKNLVRKVPYRVQRYMSKEAFRYVEKLNNGIGIDLIHLDKTELFPYAEALPGVPTVPTNHNVESRLFLRRAQRESTILRRSFAYLQYWKTELYEKSVLSRVQGYITCTDVDSRYFKETLKIETPAVTIDNGVDTNYYAPRGLVKEDYILIIGAQSKEATANYDATIYFMDSIWPLVKKVRPRTILKFVGRHPDRSILRFAEVDPRVEVVGYVPDEREIFEKAKVLAVPLRIGGGSRLKILMAFALMTAVVSTTIGAEGIQCKSERDILVEDEPVAFSQGLLRLLDNDRIRGQIETNARKLAELSYDWTVIGDRIQQYYESLVMA